LPRACLGKKFFFIYKWLSKGPFLLTLFNHQEEHRMVVDYKKTPLSF
jgi:hypothetical protein